MRTKQYLEDILDCINRIEDYITNGKDAFKNTPMIQDAVIRNFEIIGEIVKRIPQDILSQQPQITWRAIAGFRDVLIHDYNVVDIDEVWLTVERDLPALKDAVIALRKNLG
jgi:uncharacterized protein with HEPN domain